MATEIATAENPVQWMDAAETRAYFDRQARARLNMTGEEFLQRLDAGAWDAVIDDPDYRDVLVLSVMADVVRRAPTGSDATTSAARAAASPPTVRPSEASDEMARPSDMETAADEAFAGGNPVVWKTVEEDMADFDDMARLRLNMSGAEFLRRLDAGEWEEVIDDPGYEDVLYLALFADVAR